MDYISKSHGMFTPDLHWRVYLSNNEVLYYDHREDLQPKSSWLRCKKYIQENNLKIYKIELVFRSNIIEFPAKNAEGYFHAQAVGATMSLEGHGSFGESCDQIWKFGYLDKELNRVFCIVYRVPELLVLYSEDRTIESCGESLICF